MVRRQQLWFRKSAELGELQSQVLSLVAGSMKETLVGVTLLILCPLAAFCEGNCRLITFPDHVPGMQFACRETDQESDQ